MTGVHITECTGGAVRCSDASRLKLDKCLLANNTLTYTQPRNGSLKKPQTDLTMLMGACVFCEESSMIRAVNSGFLHSGGMQCLAGGGCAIATDITNPIPAHSSFFRCVFEGNIAGDAGGALAMIRSSCANITEVDTPSLETN